MEIVKKVFYAVFPLHSDLIDSTQKNSGFVWTKRAIASSLLLTTLVLGILTGLAFPNLLPIGTIGNFALAGATAAAGGMSILYLFGLGCGGFRSYRVTKKYDAGLKELFNEIQSS